MSDLDLTFACQTYGHTHALFDGRVAIPGVQPKQIDPLPHDTFPRMLGARAFDTCEMVPTLYLSALDCGDARFTAIEELFAPETLID